MRFLYDLGLIWKIWIKMIKKNNFFIVLNEYIFINFSEFLKIIILWFFEIYFMKKEGDD